VKVIPPLEITDARLTSSSASEPHAPAAYSSGMTYAAHAIVSVAADFKIYESRQSGNLANTPSSSPTWWRILGPTETAYSSGTTYGEGDTVSSGHRIFESLAAGNVGNPLPIAPETETDKWIDVGPTNRWAVFDLYRNTQVVAASPLTIVLTPGIRTDSIALFGLEATSVDVTMTSGGPTVYSNTIDLNTREVASWYEYFYKPFGTLPSTAVFDMPPYSDGIITVVITNTGGNVKCGGLAIGSYQYIGETMAQAESDALNFSTVARDDFGTLQLIPRRSVPKTRQKIYCNKALVNGVRKLREALDAKPAVWSALDDPTNDFFDPLLMLAIYRSMPITLDDPMCVIDLELEEL
jgi:hypothetical protein